ncbi:MAG: hypothetical protein JNM27_18905 [Leptospirales bacterium]|nr:hypothetical protein [Leptospirales bacterium]
MGGGYYSQDIAREARSSGGDVFGFQAYGVNAGTAASRREVHPILNIRGKTRECKNETPIVVALDVTRSRGDDTKIVYEKLPTFIGQIELKGYVAGAAISFCGIGDANSDRAPLQVSQFEADNRLDEAISKFWIEEGGGGTGQESYELAAYYYAKHTIIDSVQKGKKGYFFFVGDEGFYPTVNPNHVTDVCGREIPAPIPSAQVFKELQDKFQVFFLQPKKSWEERKADVDAEIQQRVESAGGQYKNVDVRASLIWNNRNDLDLHVICPSREEIFYGHKQSVCGGWLDVDMNVQGETTKPVENVRWSRGTAPHGRYKVIVQNFRFHDSPAPTDYRVEIEVNGEVKQFKGTISPKGETGIDSNILIYEFDFDPSKRKQPEAAPTEKATYAAYDDSVIRTQWATVLPAERILPIEDPARILDVMLGAIAITEGKASLDAFLSGLKGSHTEHDLQQIRIALEGLSFQKSGGPNVDPGAGGTSHSGSTRRL